MSKFVNESDQDGRLIDDCLLLIIDYLKLDDRIRIERVCKKWKRLSLQSWASLRHLELNGFKGLTDEHLLCIFTRGCKNLTSLDLSGSLQLTQDSLAIVARFCPQLKIINLTNVPASNESLRTLADGCRKLEKFHMANNRTAGVKGLWSIFYLCPSLQLVDIEGNQSLTGGCFQMLGKSLKILILNNCLQLQDNGIKNLSKNCPQLERLEVKDCYQLGDEALHCLGQGLGNLRVLNLSGELNIRKRGSLHSIAKLKLLTDLNLSRNKLVTDAVLKLIVKECSNLRSLDISSCFLSSSGLEVLHHCVNLRCLNISYIRSVTDDTVMSFKYNGVLERLTMRGCNNVGLFHKGVLSLLYTCSTLCSLDISECYSIIQKFLRDIVDDRANMGQRLPLQVMYAGTNIVPLEESLPNFITNGLHDPRLQPEAESAFSLVTLPLSREKHVPNHLLAIHLATDLESSTAGGPCLNFDEIYSRIFSWWTPPTMFHLKGLTVAERDFWQSPYLRVNQKKPRGNAASSADSLSSKVNPNRLSADDEECTMLPCEFCGVLFPIEFILQHQVECDEDPEQVTKAWLKKLLTSLQDKQEIWQKANWM